MTSESGIPPQSSAGNAQEWHARRSNSLDASAKREMTRSAWLTNLRVGLFLGFVGILALAEAGSVPPRGVWFAAFPFFGFFVAIVVHQRIRDRRIRFETGRTTHREALRRIERDWDNVELIPYTAPDDHAYAHDLDVVGPASLTHLLSTVRTPAGRATLQSWLLQEADRETIRQRQTSVTDLVAHRVLREEIEVAARLYVRPTARSLSNLRRWLAEPSWLAPRTWLLWYSIVSTGVTFFLMAAHLSGMIPYALWLAPVILNFIVSRSIMTEVHSIFERVSSGEGSFVAYESILRLFSDARFTAPRLIELQSQVRGENWSAPDVIAQFRRSTSLSEIRRSFVGPVLQGVMMWDVWVLRSLERWRNKWHTYANTWFDVAAEAEVLSTFGSLRDDNPSWCLPDITDDVAGKLVAKRLGHPLLPSNSRVSNDVTVGPKGTFVFVTGSNMSGKSTLLRAVGCNVVLANAGAPVCCEEFTLPVVQLQTNMRVSDSLATGESYYLAALRRLKLVIDAARSARVDEPQVLYLLDEILQGTNSAERKIAVQGVMRELLRLHAIGAITSHDLSLIDESDLESVAHSVHFTETVGQQGGETVMTFDYTLRSGIAPTRNALRLMEIIGLRSKTDDY